MSEARDATPGPATFKLATWNIHYGIGSDRRFDIARIVQVLGEIDADIVGLQEVGWHRRTHHRIDHFAYLREHTDYTVVAGLVRDPLRSHFGNALLTRFPVTATRWIDLKIRGHVPRAAVLAEIETPAGPLRVAALHLGLVTWERERQAKRLVAALKEEEQKSAEQKAEEETESTRPTALLPTALLPTVLLGDFNMLRARSLAGDILAARFPFCVRLPSYPARRPRLSLDRIYLSAEWEILNAGVVDQGLALQASDHLPLVAEARLKP